MVEFIDWVSQNWGYSDVFEAIAEAFLVYYFFSRLVGKPKKKFLVLFPLFFCQDLTVTYFEQFSVMTYFIALTTSLFISSRFFKGSRKSFYILLYCLITIIVESSVSHISSGLYVVSSTFDQVDSLKHVFFYLCSDIMQFYFIQLVVLKKKYKDKALYLHSSVTTLLVMITIILVYNSLLVVYLENNPIFRLLSVGSILVMVFGSYFVLQLLEKLEKQYKVEFENNTLNEQLYYQKQTQLKILANQNEIRGIKHDLKNQLIIMQHLLKKGHYQQLEHYFSELELTKIDDYQTIFTDNVMIDSMILHLEERCKEHSIQLDLSVFSIEFQHVNEKDVAICLGNTFDNAIEAVNKIANDQKKITVQFKVKNGYLIILIKNSVSNKKIDPFNTSKKDQLNHGFGWKNMQKITTKYNGEVRFERQDTTATVRLIFKDY
ncbi:sensor histidine kinase [Carnobacterium divergens]|uniref:sensor histidine kinase n=1 Tax=Carnobacterium divergens TaxID=2748 RepID=UPI001430BDD2|nr:GHKL domain-containing protein [Carnobacterium divergens]